MGTAGLTNNNDFDEIMIQVGNSGRFQKIFNILFNFVFMTLATLAGFNMLLASAVPDHWCKIHETDLKNLNNSTEDWHNFIPRKGNSSEFSQCEMYSLPLHNLSINQAQKTGCLNGWEYDKTYYTQTIPSQEDWVCDKEINVANFLVFGKIGEIIGTFIFSQLGDGYGRRPVFYATIIITIIGRMGLLVCKGVYLLYIIFAVIGGLPGLLMTQSTLVIGLEISSVEDRTRISLLQNVAFTLGLCLGPLIFWVVGSWTIFIAVSTLPLASVLLFQKYMIESPRWLASRGKTKRCTKQLKKIAKINKCEVSHDLLFRINEESNITSEEKEQNILALFSSLRIANKSLHVIIQWVTFIMVYSVLLLNVNNLDGNPLFNFFWQALAELPGYIAGKYLCDIIGRRFTKVSSYFIMGLLCLLISYLIPVPGYEFAISLCGIILKCLTSVAFYSLQLHTLEIFPTSLRQTGTAVGYFVASIFGIFSPYIVYLGTSIDPRYPYIICAIFSVIGSISSLFLPETLNKRLPETVKDAEEFGIDHKFCGIA